MNRFSELLAKLPASMILVSRAGKVLFANEAATPILLHFETEAEGNINGDGLALIQKIQSPSIAEVLEISEAGMILEVTVSLASEEEGIFLFFGRDVTREKELEQEKLRLSRQQTLAATVTTYAHEIGNPLSIALGYASQPLEKLTPEKYEKIHKALIRISSVLEAIREAGESNSTVPVEIYAGTDNMIQLKKRNG